MQLAATLELRRRLRRTLEQLGRCLRNEELRRQAMMKANFGEAIVHLTMEDCERLLWPAARALDDPDLGHRFADKLKVGLLDLLGSWRLEYLSICETDDLEKTLDRLSTHCPEPRHFEERWALLEIVLNPTRREDAKPVAAAIAKVEELIGQIE